MFTIKEIFDFVNFFLRNVFFEGESFILEILIMFIVAEKTKKYCPVTYKRKSKSFNTVFKLSLLWKLL